MTGSNSWQTLLQNQGYTVEVCSTASDMQTCLNTASISLDDVGVMILPGLGNTNIGYANSDIADWIDDGGIYYQVMWEHSGGCCGATNWMALAQEIFNELSWSGLSGNLGVGSGFTIGQSDIDAITNNGGTLDYSGLLNKTYQDMAIMVLNIPSIVIRRGQ